MTRPSEYRKADTCYRGHEFTPENTGNAGGYRQCKTCKREGDRARRAKRAKPRGREVVPGVVVGGVEKTCEAIADEWGVSPQYVNRLLLGALEKLRSATHLLEFTVPDPVRVPPGAPLRPESAPQELVAPVWSKVGTVTGGRREAERAPDWSRETSRVVSGPIGNIPRFPGRRFESRAAAREYWLKRTGRIYEDFKIPGRYVFRVPKGGL